MPLCIPLQRCHRCKKVQNQPWSHFTSLLVRFPEKRGWLTLSLVCNSWCLAIALQHSLQLTCSFSGKCPFTPLGPLSTCASMSERFIWPHKWNGTNVLGLSAPGATLNQWGLQSVGKIHRAGLSGSWNSEVCLWGCSEGSQGDSASVP